MRVVITHTDFRIYWPSRIQALQQVLEHRGDELYVVEIAGMGSNYAFSDHTGASQIRNWECLFPDEKMESIPATRASRKLLTRLDELDPDVIMAGSIAYPSGAAAVYWAKAHQKAVIIFDDIRPEDVPRNAIVNYIKKLIYGQVDAVLCPAQPWTDAFLRWDFSPEQLFFGVDVVDNAFWSKTDVKASIQTAVQETIGIATPYLLAVGRQIVVKNFFFLLQAYEQYQAIMGAECLPLVIIGDGPEKPVLENYIQEQKLEQVYLLPFVDPATLRTYYHQAAALVLPSRSETWGLVVNEAMAAGLPVLVSKACGCASVLVQEAVNGYTFSPDCPHQLLEALLDFTRQGAAAKIAMGKASQRLIRPWGLNQFVRGGLRAIDYARTNKKVCQSIQARFVIKRWKGRYRPI